MDEVYHFEFAMVMRRWNCNNEIVSIPFLSAQPVRGGVDVKILPSEMRSLFHNGGA
jgi:hypothetical protein